MPTYRNTSETTRLFDGCSSPIEPSGEVQTKGYLESIPAGFELVADTPNTPLPWVELADDLVANLTTLTGLAQYPQIKVVNQSGAEISIVANGDADATTKLVTGAIEYYTTKRSTLGLVDINSLTITGDGTSGNVSVYGMK